MFIKRFVFNQFQVNTYLYIDDKTGQAAVIDPGMQTREEEKLFFDFVENNSISLKYVLLTHGHFDHFCGGVFLQENNVPFIANKKILRLLEHIDDFSNMFGIEITFVPNIDMYISENDVINIGSLNLYIKETPGHCPGHVCFLDKENKILFSGDLLFHNSIGRTDLPEGDYDLLVGSIKNKIFSMKENYKVYPGHGPETTLGDEILSNPFIMAMYQ